MIGHQCVQHRSRHAASILPNGVNRSSCHPLRFLERQFSPTTSRLGVDTFGWRFAASAMRHVGIIVTVTFAVGCSSTLFRIACVAAYTRVE